MLGLRSIIDDRYDMSMTTIYQYHAVSDSYFAYRPAVFSVMHAPSRPSTSNQAKLESEGNRAELKSGFHCHSFLQGAKACYVLRRSARCCRDGCYKRGRLSRNCTTCDQPPRLLTLTNTSLIQIAASPAHNDMDFDLDTFYHERDKRLNIPDEGLDEYINRLRSSFKKRYDNSRVRSI